MSASEEEIEQIAPPPKRKRGRPPKNRDTSGSVSKSPKKPQGTLTSSGSVSAIMRCNWEQGFKKEEELPEAVTPPSTSDNNTYKIGTAAELDEFQQSKDKYWAEWELNTFPWRAREETCKEFGCENWRKCEIEHTYGTEMDENRRGFQEIMNVVYPVGGWRDLLSSK